MVRATLTAWMQCVLEYRSTLAGDGRSNKKSTPWRARKQEGQEKPVIKITATSVFVDDQARALEFYTEVLGFVKKRDIPLGGARWLTVVSPAESGGIELLLEPNSNPIAKTYQQGSFEAGLPATTFATDDLQWEYERLKELNVVFTMEPTEAFGSAMAVFDDTCGNLIQLHQVMTSD